ncbi:flagellar protein FlaG [Stutzerimonas stutzeri]|uniref:flagellar protein FlaG n=1 Tax=Stutzerimonas stutzeri TaxID=316 RepID=UPI0006522F1F|nr:flagellar protein FlaG [Stutzerimonas stutzeri]
MESISATSAAPVGLARRDTQLIDNYQASTHGDSLKEKNESTSVSIESANSAAQAFKSFVQDIQRNLDFSVDDSSGQVVVKVIDGESGKLIRQIPSEELLRLSERLEDMRSLLFKAQA